MVKVPCSIILESWKISKSLLVTMRKVTMKRHNVHIKCIISNLKEIYPKTECIGSVLKSTDPRRVYYSIYKRLLLCMGLRHVQLYFSHKVVQTVNFELMSDNNVMGGEGSLTYRVYPVTYTVKSKGVVNLYSLLPIRGTPDGGNIICYRPITMLTRYQLRTIFPRQVLNHATLLQPLPHT